MRCDDFRREHNLNTDLFSVFLYYEFASLFFDFYEMWWLIMGIIQKNQNFVDGFDNDDIYVLVHIYYWCYY